MKVLSIDPGYDRCGIAVLEGMGAKAALRYSACITTSKNEEFVARLAAIEKSVEEVFYAHTPEVLAIEKLHLKANRQSAMHVAETRGVILALAGKHGMPVYEYAPASVKVAVTGYGKADKNQVMAMVKRLIVCPTRAMLDDEYDAIAVGLTHLASKTVRT